MTEWSLLVPCASVLTSNPCSKVIRCLRLDDDSYVGVSIFVSIIVAPRLEISVISIVHAPCERRETPFRIRAFNIGELFPWKTDRRETEFCQADLAKLQVRSFVFG